MAAASAIVWRHPTAPGLGAPGAVRTSVGSVHQEDGAAVMVGLAGDRGGVVIRFLGAGFIARFSPFVAVLLPGVRVVDVDLTALVVAALRPGSGLQRDRDSADAD